MSAETSFWSQRPVCVTGGTGFLGYHLVLQLLERGATVRVLSLPPRPNHPILCQNVERIEGDIRDPDSVRQAVAGCDVVFHTAGVVGVWGPALERMWSVHVEGTRNVLAAAPRHAPIVYTSSIMAVGASATGNVLDEESSFGLEGLNLPYCQAKRSAEALALAADRDVVVTNPGYLVGPEDYERSVMGRFCVRFWRGSMPLAPPGGINLADVRDVATGHLRAVERGRSGERYILGGENHSFAAFMRLLAAAIGFAPRGLPRLPYWLLNAVAYLAELRARFTGKEPVPALAHVRLNRYCWYYRSDKAQRELGYAPRPLTDTLADTLRWLRTRKRLEPRGLRRWWMRPGIMPRPGSTASAPRPAHPQPTSRPVP